MASGAYDWALLYGLATVLLALFLGWGASVIFRRLAGRTRSIRAQRWNGR
ncbi:TIGR02186 family protein [Bosea thiooxidans]